MSVANVLQSASNFGKDHLVNFTKVLNNDANPGAVDLFMDAAAGRGHRIVTGHDFSYLPEVYEKFGLDGVYNYFKHLGKDVMSPDGIPIPFANELQSTLGLTTKESIDWLCLNVGDLLSGGFSIWHTKETIAALQAGNLSNDFVLKILLGSSIKIFFSVNSPNPISLACGIIDLGALSYYAYPVYSEYVSAFLRPEATWSEMLKNSLEVSGFGFAMSFTLEGLRNSQALINKDISLKHYIKKVSKAAAIDGAFSGASSLISSATEKYLNVSKGTKTAIAMGSFVGMKYAYNRATKNNGPVSSDLIVDTTLIPSYC